MSSEARLRGEKAGSFIEGAVSLLTEGVITLSEKSYGFSTSPKGRGKCFFLSSHFGYSLERESIFLALPPGELSNVVRLRGQKVGSFIEGAVSLAD